MKCVNRIQICGPFDRLFDTAADIARWPEFLPHYRWVKVLERTAGDVRAEMAARHKGFPLWWRALQKPMKEEKKIRFTHIGGITRGMEVEWTFQEVGASGAGPTWLVQIDHEFTPSWPTPGPWFAKHVIGNVFVHQVAGKTLRRLKEVIESGQPT